MKRTRAVDEPRSLSPARKKNKPAPPPSSPTKQPIDYTVIAHKLLPQSSPRKAKRLASSVTPTYSLRLTKARLIRYSSSHVSVNSLPEEILFRILSYLPSENLVVVSRVCKQWHALEQDDQLWRQLYMRRWSSSGNMRVPAEVLPKFQRNGILFKLLYKEAFDKNLKVEIKSIINDIKERFHLRVYFSDSFPYRQQKAVSEKLLSWIARHSADLQSYDIESIWLCEDGSQFLTESAIKLGISNLPKDWSHFISQFKEFFDKQQKVIETLGLKECTAYFVRVENAIKGFDRLLEVAKSLHEINVEGLKFDMHAYTDYSVRHKRISFPWNFDIKRLKTLLHDAPLSTTVKKKLIACVQKE
jgi:hypothetical protein